jgi:cobalt/nickel transport system permease protein
MIGVHVLIGIGEGVITAMTVSAVLATRPDLVYGASTLRGPASATLDTVGATP